MSLGIKWLDWLDQPMWCRMLYLNTHEGRLHMDAYDDGERSRKRKAAEARRTAGKGRR